MSELNLFQHQIPIQIRFADIDRLDHVNNACYLSFFELGRVSYFNAVFKKLIDWNKMGFVLARTEIDHQTPIFLNDVVFCYSKIIKLGTKSLTFQNIIVKKEKDQLIECATGIGVLVAMDYVSQQSIEIPKNWRSAIEAFEKILS